MFKIERSKLAKRLSSALIFSRSIMYSLVISVCEHYFTTLLQHLKGYGCCLEIYFASFETIVHAPELKNTSRDDLEYINGYILKDDCVCPRMTLSIFKDDLVTAFVILFFGTTFLNMNWSISVDMSL